VLNSVDRELLLRALEPLVLGFAGKIGSGKSTVSTEVASALGWTRASFGDYLRSRAQSSGFDQSRDVLQEIGASLVASDPKEFCRAVLAHYKWNAGEPLVIDGIRHEEVLEALRALVAPLELRLIFLDVPDDQRLARLQKVNETVAENLARVELHSTETQVTERLKELADLRLTGTLPVGELVSTVVGWVHQGDGALKPCLA
jgi:cytidylate kinase